MRNLKKVAFIICGGNGERLWPISTKKKPKQFLNIASKVEMINATISRVLESFNENEIFIITNKEQAKLVKSVLRYKVQILKEPKSKDTAIAILYAIMSLNILKEDTLIGVFPSDHYIDSITKFKENIDYGLKLAKEDRKIIAYGMKPTFPSTDYGYIECENKEGSHFKVMNFKEKPNVLVASSYLQEGNYYWNCGIYIFLYDVIINEYKKKMGSLYKKFVNKEYVTKIYGDSKYKSIDYEIMEKCDNMLLIPIDFAWSDLGTYSNLEKVLTKDALQNVKVGKCKIYDTKESLIYSKDNNLVVTLGISNLIVVNNDGIVFVADKKYESKIKEIIKKIDF